jgi:hypothetical protein
VALSGGDQIAVENLRTLSETKMTIKDIEKLLRSVDKT